MANEGKNPKTGENDYIYSQFKGMWDRNTNKFDPSRIMAFFHHQFKLAQPSLVGRKQDIILYLTSVQTFSTGGSSLMSPLYNKNTIVFRENLDHLPTYAHEIGHTLGVPHTFKENYPQKIEEARIQIKKYEDWLNLYSVYVAQNPTNEVVKNAKYFKKRWTDTKTGFEKIREYDKYKFRLGGTDNFMDYNNRPKSFYIWQIRVMQRETKLYYYEKKANTSLR